MDASFDENTNKSGIGLILTDAAGNYQRCKTIAVLAKDPEEAESLAVLEAVKWLKTKNQSKISIKWDANNVISHLNKSANQIS